MNLKLELIFKDRVGIIADISTIIAQQGDNIVSMEIERREDRAHVYLETETREQATRFEKLFETLSKVDDLIQIHLINTLPRKKEKTASRWCWTTSVTGWFQSTRKEM